MLTLANVSMLISVNTSERFIRILCSQFILLNRVYYLFIYFRTIHLVIYVVFLRTLAS